APGSHRHFRTFTPLILQVTRQGPGVLAFNKDLFFDLLIIEESGYEGCPFVVIDFLFVLFILFRLRSLFLLLLLSHLLPRQIYPHCLLLCFNPHPLHRIHPRFPHPLHHRNLLIVTVDRTTN
ncbi:hypothetical protein PIB30_096718, partial [Stylosanthes scabra]|nr:hypothetical protein [Stylosanthes scabra]